VSERLPALAEDFHERQGYGFQVWEQTPVLFARQGGCLASKSWCREMNSERTVAANIPDIIRGVRVPSHI
jgi:hypothetical protein